MKSVLTESILEVPLSFIQLESIINDVYDHLIMTLSLASDQNI